MTRITRIAAILSLVVATSAQAQHWWNRKHVTTPPPQPHVIAAFGMSTLEPATNPLADFDAAVHRLLSGSTSLPQFTLDDLNNMKAIYQAKVDAGGGLMDKQGVICADKLIAFQPQLAGLTTLPTLTVGAPVTGFFSGWAASQVKAETAKAQSAALLTLVQNGLPPEVTIACAPIFTNPLQMFSLHQ